MFPAREMSRRAAAMARHVHPALRLAMGGARVVLVHARKDGAVVADLRHLQCGEWGGGGAARAAQWQLHIRTRSSTDGRGRTAASCKKEGE